MSALAFLLSGLLRGLLRALQCILPFDLSQMRRDDFSAALDCERCSLFDIVRRLRRQRAPAAVEVLKGRYVGCVVHAMAVPFQRRAKCIDLTGNLRPFPILRVECIALLFENLVDALVLVADLPEKLPEL